MKPELTLAYSPCPNDTFLFYHLIHEDTSEKFSVKEELHDVEKLNQYAEQNNSTLRNYLSLPIFMSWKVTPY